MADLEDLEARVTRLEHREQEGRHVTSSRLDAIHFGIGQLHDMLHEFRDETNARFNAIDHRFAVVDTHFEGVEGRFDGLEGRMGRMESDVTEIKGVLGQILDRLPPA